MIGKQVDPAKAKALSDSLSTALLDAHRSWEKPTSARLRLARKHELATYSLHLREAIGGTMASARLARDEWQVCARRLTTEKARLIQGPRNVCPYCWRFSPYDAGRASHDSYCESSYLSAWIKDRPGGVQDEKMLQSDLDRARHVGH
jgi:hypothetical protein